MKRRTLAASAAFVALALSAACLPALAQTPAPKTLKVVAHADLKILDPTFTTAYISRNFGYMVYDTLFAQDSTGKPQPQMVEKYTASKDGKQWSFTLRPGLKFSDGSAVTSADAVASLQRWAARDSLGRAMTASGAEWKQVDARNFTLTLTEPFGMVLDALAKPSGFPPVVLPERLAKMPATAPLTEVLGSGPFIFKRDEWVPGNKAVFVRNPNYVARSEPPNGLAGSKKSNFERVEWLYLPDSPTAPIVGAQARRSRHRRATAARLHRTAAHRHQREDRLGRRLPGLPGHEPAAPALQQPQSAPGAAAGGEPGALRRGHGLIRWTCAWPTAPPIFICGSPNETSAGAEPYRKADVAKAKKMLADAGYKGEKVTLLVPSDVPYLNAEALMAAQTMKSIGINVDAQNLDWASIGARRAKRDAPEAGGWNMYVTVAGEFDANSPISQRLPGRGLRQHAAGLALRQDSWTSCAPRG
jgi:peptide/nickel transport system substrate-binding protein